MSLLAERSNTIVFAGARDPANASDLQAVAAKHPDNVFVVELKASDVEGNTRAIEQIRQKTGRLDVVIANAGKSAPPSNLHVAIIVDDALAQPSPKAWTPSSTCRPKPCASITT